MSQKEFALAIGHDRKTVGNWENGKNSNPPNYGDLMLISSVTDVSLEWLAGDLFRPTTGVGVGFGGTDTRQRSRRDTEQYEPALAA